MQAKPSKDDALREVRNGSLDPRVLDVLTEADVRSELYWLASASLDSQERQDRRRAYLDAIMRKRKEPKHPGGSALARAAAKVTPAVEVIAVPARPPFEVGKFYVASVSGIDYPWPEFVAGPFETAGEAAAQRTGGQQVVRATEG